MSTALKVFCFGKMALNSADSFRYAGKLLQSSNHSSILLLASAIDGIPDLLEEIADAHQKGETKKALEVLNTVRKKHYDIATEILGADHSVHDELNDHLVTIEWDLEDVPLENANFGYDQIVAIGVLLSTQLLAAYLNDLKLTTHWFDVRDVILADDEFRNGNILVQETNARIKQHLKPLLEKGGIVLTQAALGTTTENYSITLNQNEGSAYSAAVIGDCLDAEELYIWTKPLIADSNLTKNVIQFENK